MGKLTVTHGLQNSTQDWILALEIFENLVLGQVMWLTSSLFWALIEEK